MVDDDGALCESMDDYLAQHSDTYQFLGGVCTRSSAIELFKDGMPDIVILDMMLGPGLDGSDLIDDFRKIAKEQGLKTEIFVVSKSSVYESYCVKSNLMFRQKGENHPESLMKWIERFVGSAPSEKTPVKLDITPKTRRERMKDYLFNMFSRFGAHKYGACDDCMYIIPRMVELKEAGKSFPLEEVYEEWGRKCKSTKDAIEARIRNMLKAVWTKFPDDELNQFYPPYLKEQTTPTPLPFIDYYAKRLMMEYPNNIEKTE